MKKRILYIDYMKAIAIILVIIGHVNFANDGVKAWIYAFHMPAFFFCSGLVLTNGKTTDPLECMRNKFKRLMIPYFLWALLFAKFSIKSLLLIIYGSYWSISRSGALSSLWFLPVIFIALGFYYMLDYTGAIKNLVLKLLITLLAFSVCLMLPSIKYGYPWAADVALMAFTFLLLGNATRSTLDKLFNWAKSSKILGLFFLFTIMIILVLGSLLYKYNEINGGYVLMSCARYGNILLFFFVAFWGTLMLVLASMILELLNARGFKWLIFVGQNTLCIFAVQKPIINLFKVIFQHLQWPNSLVLAVTSVGTLIISCLLCVFINKYTPILVGKNKM